ncbi:MAG: hypothetical protein JXM70_24810 [Pirellulales bacterium]|nr:hypothetical protein [Pirellulales bacterium]
MSPRSQNTQMFALKGRPPETFRVAGTEYRLARVFKHDFWAATCLYERITVPAASGDILPRIVVKFGRQQAFAGVPLEWIGQWLADHEQAIYKSLAGVAGVPRWVGRLSPICYAIEYIDAPPLDHLETIPPGLFDRLRDVFDAIHARGVAYGDSNKKSHILVDAAGHPTVIDFQISLRLRDDWPWPLRNLARRIIAYLQGKDIYHLYKHKRRLAPAELTEAEERLSRKRSGLHILHRKLTKPYRSLRRTFLRKQHQDGKLQSPTADLEDHHQPEKETWRD